MQRLQAGYVSSHLTWRILVGLSQWKEHARKEGKKHTDKFCILASTATILFSSFALQGIN